MTAEHNNSPPTASTIKTQTKILAGFFGLLVVGLLLVFLQSFKYTRSALLNDYLVFFSQQATSLDNAVGQVVNHVNMMKSIADTQLAINIDPLLLRSQLSRLNELSDYRKDKNYHIYRVGEIINNKEVIATIVGRDTAMEQNESYVRFVALAVELQAFQKAYQSINPNFVLSYYSSHKYTNAEFYPPIDMVEFVSKSKDLAQWMNDTSTIFAGNETPEKNPQGNLFWTDTYMDPVGNGMMVSCVVPLYDQGAFIGLLGSDVVLDFLNQHTDRLESLPGLRAIITEGGKVVSATGINYTQKSEIITIERILPTYRASFIDTFDQTSIHEEATNTLFTTTLKNAPWRYIFAVENEVIFATTMKRLRGLAFATILFIFSIPAIFIIIYRRSIRPGIAAESALLLLNKELDSKVTERTKELKEREAYSKKLFEDSRIPLVVMDALSFQFTDCNNAALEIYGFKSMAEALGKTPLDVSVDIQYDGTASTVLAPKYIVEALEKGSVSFEWKHQRPDGEVWDAEVQLMSIRHEGKLLLHFSLLDITKRKRAIQERRRLEEQLAQSRKMDAIGQLAGGIAHDFNNMLAGIIGAAELLSRPKRNLDDKSQKYVNLIISASARAADLTAKLLAFGRKENMEFCNLDVSTCLSDTIAMLTNTVDKNISIISEYTASNSVISGDGSSLLNSFINLGINASHAMSAGGTLHFTTKNIDLDANYCAASSFPIKPGPFIEIEIRDTGQGISSDNIKKIFEPFFTTKAQGEGTGLGLAAVYGTIQKHHGAIDVYSELGVGTVFRIYLPVITATVEVAQTDDDIERITGTGCILFVDDEETLRLVGASILEDLGYDVMTAQDGAEALRLFKENSSKIDLVITDMMMPVMDGRELFNRIIEIKADCKILLSSGFTKDEDFQKLSNAGISGFLRKPFRDIELSQVVAKILKT